MPIPASPPPQLLPWLSLRGLTANSHGSGTAVSFSFDTAYSGNGWPTPAVPLTAIICPVAGRLRVTCDDIDWQDSAEGPGAGIRLVSLQKTGDVTTRRAFQNTAPMLDAADSTTAQSGSKIWAVPAGFSLAVVTRQTSGSTISGVVLDWVHFEYVQLGTFPFTMA